MSNEKTIKEIIIYDSELESQYGLIDLYKKQIKELKLTKLELVLLDVNDHNFNNRLNAVIDVSETCHIKFICDFMKLVNDKNLKSVLKNDKIENISYAPPCIDGLTLELRVRAYKGKDYAFAFMKDDVRLNDHSNLTDEEWKSNKHVNVVCWLAKFEKGN